MESSFARPATFLVSSSVFFICPMCASMSHCVQTSEYYLGRAVLSRPLREFCVIGLIVRIGKVRNYNSPNNFSLILFSSGVGFDVAERAWDSLSSLGSAC